MIDVSFPFIGIGLDNGGVLSVGVLAALQKSEG